MIRFLIVDDSALARKVLGQIFRVEGDFEIEFARDGAAALEVIQAIRPDVVTLDIHMPGLDGLACLDRIMLEHPCPVVMVSALTEDGLKRSAPSCCRKWPAGPFSKDAAVQDFQPLPRLDAITV